MIYSMIRKGNLAGWEDKHRFAIQTLVDNVSRLKTDRLVDINQIVAEAGHELLKKVIREKHAIDGWRHRNNIEKFERGSKQNSEC